MITKNTEARSDKVERKGCAQKEIRYGLDERDTIWCTRKTCNLNLISNTKMCNYYNLICRGGIIMGDLCLLVYFFCVKFLRGTYRSSYHVMYSFNSRKNVVKNCSFLCSSVARSLKGRRKGM